MENKAIFNGLLMGGASIIVTLLFYFINPRFLMTTGAYIMYGIFLFFMFRAVIDSRAQQGGFITFSEGLKAAFLSYVIGGLMYYLFNHILVAFIDPSLVEITKEVAIEAIEKMESFIGEDATAEAIDQLDEVSYKPTLANTLMGYVISLIFGFIFSLIIAAIYKKEDKSMFA